MKYSNNVINILALKKYEGIGNGWIIKNFKGNESDTEIIDKINANNHVTSLNEFNFIKNNIITELEKIQSSFDGALGIGDLDFPQYRGNVRESDRPVVIFYRGNIKLLNKDNKLLSVIGLLKPNNIIEEFEKKVVDYLVKSNYTIVSGLALGCDTFAHEQTLNSCGKTIAILPSPLHEILPASNRYLAEKIVSASGLLITEYYNSAGYKELSGRYVERDRLQALYSDGIILSASYSKNNLGNDSGSRHAMGYAKKYSIKRAVLEPLSNDAMFDLNREIISGDNSVYIIKKDNMEQSILQFCDKQNFAKKEELSIMSFLEED